MPQSKSAGRSVEVELKLAVLSRDARLAAQRLHHSGSLARLQSSVRTLHTIYFDTPDRRLAKVGAALRVRREDPSGTRHWQQTLKTAKAGGGVLSLRGEWEAPVRAPKPEHAGLPGKAWGELDPEGSLFPMLIPRYATRFQRIAWLARLPRGGIVEVALDHGRIVAGRRSERLQEIEFELKKGARHHVTDLARAIVRDVGTWPLRTSKAARGDRLAEARTPSPVGAHPPRLADGEPLSTAARTVMNEIYWQLADNLMGLRTHDDPEWAHQARIGWRRWRTACKLFRKALAAAPPPDTTPLRPLMQALGRLRDIEVTLTEVMPGLERIWVGRSARRQLRWQAATALVERARAQARRNVCMQMARPACGAVMLEMGLWLEPGLHSAMGAAQVSEEVRIDRDWARTEIRRLRRRLDNASAEARSPEQWHEVRLLAKRLRYSTEMLADLLPARRASAIRRHAGEIQRSIGSRRDTELAAQILTSLGVEREIVSQLARLDVTRS